MNKKISIVVPAHNEEGNIDVLIENLFTHTKNLNYSFEYIFVDDGSSDHTLSKLKYIASKYSNVFYVELSKNFGHQLALKTGLDLSTGDAVISMDADLQHPPYLIPNLIAEWENGFDVVYTIREEDKELPFLKRLTSKNFYKLINYLADINIEQGVADFRLMDKKVVNVFKTLNEKELFIRGLVSWVGFNQKGLAYKPEKRFSGTSKYTYKKMIQFAIQGITSFSIKPLYLTIYFGLFLSFVSIIFYAIYLFYSIYHNIAISGWASLISTVVFFGGLNLTVLGIIGIYIGKLFIQSKNRPNYIIKNTNLTL